MKLTLQTSGDREWLYAEGTGSFGKPQTRWRMVFRICRPGRGLFSLRVMFYKDVTPTVLAECFRAVSKLAFW